MIVPTVALRVSQERQSNIIFELHVILPSMIAVMCVGYPFCEDVFSEGHPIDISSEHTS